jgi:hypothetical protein
MPSRYLMQIVDRQTEEVVSFEPGQRVETNFVDDCVNRTMAKGVGVGRSSAHVERDMRDGIEEAIHDLKSKVRP